MATRSSAAESRQTRDRETVLEVRGLTVAFAGTNALHNLSFAVRRGQVLAIIGPNGCGKTVLLKVLLHLLPYRGEIIWAPGVRIGYVPQKVAVDRQMPLLVRDFLEAKARFLRLPSDAVEKACAETGIPKDLLEAGIGVLSGGQFQKMLIASSLLGDPEVLLFDEPTASLDELEEERIYQLLDTLRAERGLSVLLVSHDLSTVHRNADLVLCLSRATACLGTPDKILTPEVLEAAYGTPRQYYRHRRNPGKNV
jgi:zinc transport system ATP-binding protein